MEASNAPDDEAGVGDSFSDLVEETDVPRVGFEGVEGVEVKAQQVSGGDKPAPKSTEKKA
jgi:hypothetical protein